MSTPTLKTRTVSRLARLLFVALACAAVLLDTGPARAQDARTNEGADLAVGGPGDGPEREMASLRIDIPGERVGPFHVGQELHPRGRIVDKDGRELRSGDAAYLEPYRDVSVSLLFFEAEGGPGCRVVELLAEDGADATLDGKRLAEASLRELTGRMKAAGHAAKDGGHGDLYVGGAYLHVHGDHIEKVFLGVDDQRFEREWREVIDPLAIDAIVRAASDTALGQGTSAAE